MGRILLSTVKNCSSSTLKEARDKENEGFDRLGRPRGDDFGVREVRFEGIRKPYRQRSPSRPRRISMANFSQIRSRLLLPETTHLRRYPHRSRLGPLRRSLLRYVQEPLQIPRPRRRMAPEQ